MKKYFLVLAGIYILLNFTACKSAKKDSANAQANADSLLQVSDDTSISFLNDTIALPSSSDMEEVLLQLNPEKGKIYRTVLETSSEISQSAMGQSMDSKMYSSTSNTLTVNGTDADGNINITSTVKKFKASMQDGENKIEIEQGKPTTDPQADMLRQIMESYIDMPIKITLNKNAEVGDVSGMEDIQKKIVEKFGDSAMMAASQVGDLNQEVLNSFVTFPGGRLKVGDTWIKQDAIDLGGFPAIMKNNYTLYGIKDGLAIIELRSILSLDKETVKKAGANPDDISMSGSQTGKLSVDVNTGWTMQSEMMQDIKIKMSMQGQTVNVSVKGNSTMKTVN